MDHKKLLMKELLERYEQYEVTEFECTKMILKYRIRKLEKELKVLL